MQMQILSFVCSSWYHCNANFFINTVHSHFVIPVSECYVLWVQKDKAVLNKFHVLCQNEIQKVWESAKKIKCLKNKY